MLLLLVMLIISLTGSVILVIIFLDLSYHEI